MLKISVTRPFTLIIDLNADLLANYDQHLKTTYSYQESADVNQSMIENESVNSIRIKTSFGTILTMTPTEEQNQTSEALKVRGGVLFTDSFRNKHIDILPI